MDLMGARIRLNPRPTRNRPPVLEAALLGHCPGPVRLERVRAQAWAEMRGAGFGEAVDALTGGTRASLEHLPLPLYSAAEFEDVFPLAATRSTAYASLLAGDRAWLPRAVADYFANGGEKLWIIAIPEAEGQAGFLPAPGTRLHEATSLHGLAVALVLESVGVIALPDLERLQVPARLPDTPARLRLANPQPAFLPCAEEYDDGHRERSYSEELPVAPPAPWRTRDLLELLGDSLRQHRPDMQCLFSLPLAYSGARGLPVIDPATLADIEALKLQPAGAGLRRLQLLFPYLRGPDLPLCSVTGALAGLQAAVARRQGPWRSAAGRALRIAGKPYPPQSRQEVVRLREQPGIGVLELRNGQVLLDDERLAMPALHRADYAEALDAERFQAYRSGEVARFLGFLMRRLRAFGDSLVFNGDYRDQRPRYLLEDFLRRLYSEGALRGRLPEEAYSIRQRHPQEGALVFEIELAPAFPIDRLQLTFANSGGDWTASLAGAERLRPAAIGVVSAGATETAEPADV